MGPVHLAYNSSYSACFFSQNNIFLSQKKSTNRVFQPAYNSSRTGPLFTALYIGRGCLDNLAAEE
jgi:hypothetical protein